MIGLALAASGHWPYGMKYSGAIVVANFNFAILMRNEVFGRILYLFVNTFFAKVCSYYRPIVLFVLINCYSGLLSGSDWVALLFSRFVD